jgi:Flp pilus assembly pilin Flp
MISNLRGFSLRRFLAFLSDQRGMTSIEYGLIIMAISLAVMVGYFLAGDALEEMMLHAASGVERARSGIMN